MKENELAKMLWNSNTLSKAIDGVIRKKIANARSCDDLLAIANELMLYSFGGRNLETGYATAMRVAAMIEGIGTQKAKKIANVLRGVPKMKRDDEKEKKIMENAKIDTQNVREFYERIETLFDEMKQNKMKKYVTQGRDLERVKAIAKMIFVMAATGARANEVLASADFWTKDGKLYMKGVLKKRKSDNNEDEVYEVCVIDFIKPATIVRYIKEIRDYFGTHGKRTKKELYEINARWNAVINRGVRAMLGDNVTAHDVRARYAQMCLQKNNIPAENATEYIALYLRHANTVTSATHYKK